MVTTRGTGEKLTWRSVLPPVPYIGYRPTQRGGPKNGQSLKEALPLSSSLRINTVVRSDQSSGVFDIVAYCLKLCLILDLGCSKVVFVGDPAAEVAAEDRNRQRCSDPGTPPRGLSCYIDSGITSQIGIRFLAFLVGFSGIHVTIAIVFRVVMNFWIRHDVPPRVGWVVVAVVLEI